MIQSFRDINSTAPFFPIAFYRRAVLTEEDVKNSTRQSYMHNAIVHNTAILIPFAAASPFSPIVTQSSVPCIPSYFAVADIIHCRDDVWVIVIPLALG